MAQDLVPGEVFGMARALPRLRPKVKCSCRNSWLKTARAADIPTLECHARSSHSSEQTRRCDRSHDRLQWVRLTNSAARLKTPSPVRNRNSLLDQKLVPSHQAVWSDPRDGALPCRSPRWSWPGRDTPPATTSNLA